MYLVTICCVLLNKLNYWVNYNHPLKIVDVFAINIHPKLLNFTMGN